MDAAASLLTSPSVLWMIVTLLALFAIYVRYRRSAERRRELAEEDARDAGFGTQTAFTLSARRRTPSSISAGVSAQERQAHESLAAALREECLAVGEIQALRRGLFAHDIRGHTPSGSVSEMKKPPSGRVTDASGMCRSIPARHGVEPGRVKRFQTLDLRREQPTAAPLVGDAVRESNRARCRCPPRPWRASR